MLVASRSRRGSGMTRQIWSTIRIVACIMHILHILRPYLALTFSALRLGNLPVVAYGEGQGYSSMNFIILMVWIVTSMSSWRYEEFHSHKITCRLNDFWQACDLQACLNKYTYTPEKCDDHLRKLYECCLKMYERNDGGGESTACPLPEVVKRWMKDHSKK